MCRCVAGDWPARRLDWPEGAEYGSQFVDREWLPAALVIVIGLQRPVRPIRALVRPVPEQVAAQIGDAVKGQRTFVSQTLHRAGVAGSRNPERDALIIEAWKTGETRASLVATFGLSKERLRQIITSYLGSGEMPREAMRRGR